MPLCQFHRGRIAGRGDLALGKPQDLRLPGRLRWHLPGLLREAMPVVASGLCDWGVPGSMDKSGVEADAEGGQLTTAVAAANAV